MISLTKLKKVVSNQLYNQLDTFFYFLATPYQSINSELNRQIRTNMQIQI